MKGSKFILTALLVAFSFSVNAQTLVEEEEKNIFIPDFNKQGCGYTRPVRVAGMIGNPPFDWVERHDERVEKIWKVTAWGVWFWINWLQNWALDTKALVFFLIPRPSMH